MADAAAFRQCLQASCSLTQREANAVIQQGYDTARKFRIIDQESLKELFGNVTLDVMATIKKQNLRALRAFLLDCNRDQIDLTLFDADALEMQQESLSTERAV